MEFFKLSDTEKRIIRWWRRYGMLIFFVGLTLYALSDWNRFFNRYLARDEDLEHGYFYSITDEGCFIGVDLIYYNGNLKNRYQIESDSVVNILPGYTSTRDYRLDPTRLFYIWDKDVTSNGIQYYEGFQYSSDSSHRSRWGFVPAYFQRSAPKDDSIILCN